MDDFFFMDDALEMAELSRTTVKVKQLNVASITLDDVDTYDYPDFCNAYATYAEWHDGTPLTDEELENISSDVIHEAAHAEFH